MANVTVKGLELKGLKGHLKNLIGDNKPGVKVGIPEGAKYADGTSVAMIAFIHEYGAGSIPPRPFMRESVARHKGEWVKDATAYLKASAGAVDVKSALTQVGDVMAMDIQAYLEGGEITPRLKPETVREKKRLGYVEQAEKPLVRTAVLMSSISSEYVEDITSVGI